MQSAASEPRQSQQPAVGKRQWYHLEVDSSEPVVTQRPTVQSLSTAVSSFTQTTQCVALVSGCLTAPTVTCASEGYDRMTL